MNSKEMKMAFEQLTLNDVKTAYKKLKSMAYYDTYDLFLKNKIASFETDLTNSDDEDIETRFELINFEKRLEELHKSLTSWSKEKKKNYWDSRIENLNYRVLPKKIKSYKKYDTNKSELVDSFFSNVREIQKGEKYEVEKLTFFIDAPIEIHILSVLWIMKLGYFLEEDLDEKCYGNRLILEKRKANSSENRVTDDLGLFKPYYKQYQNWRDEGISIARNYLEKKHDVLFVNIDIQDYYYSVRLNFNDLKTRLKPRMSNDWNMLSEVFEKVHQKYTSVIKATGYPNDLILDVDNDKSILPIGLASSYILANWYLREFDNRVNKNISPIYYSRYVDDIFIITTTNGQQEKEEECAIIQSELTSHYGEDYLNSLSRTEHILVETLFPVITLEDCPKELFNKEKSDNRIFKISCYDHLYIQPAKTLVFHFDHNSSLALLDKFKNELEKRSSEFRFLPDEKLEENGFDDEAYELVFDDSMHKIKTLKDYKESRYGIASHLSKKIFYSLRNGKKNSKEDAQKLIKFFRGTTNLEHFRQWDRLVTYFVVNDNKEEFIQFSVNTFEQIFDLPLPSKFNGFNISYVKIAEDLLEYYSNAMEMAFALNPDFAIPLKNRITKIFGRFYQEFLHSSDRPLRIFSNWQKFRLSNMIRHNYIGIPLLNYSTVSLDSSYLECDFSKIKGMDGLKFDEHLINYSPRKIRYYEAAWMECIQRIYATKKPVPFQNRIPNDIFYGDTGDSENYLDSAFELYFKINFWYKQNDSVFKEELRKDIFEYNPTVSVEETVDNNPESLLHAHEISVGQDEKLGKLKVGLANMKVDENNYEASMLGKPMLKGRYNDFAKILNEAEKEECELIVLPELSLPHGLVKTVIDHSWNHNRAIISGIEHWTHNDVSYNFILTVLPCKIRGIKDAVPILRLKNHYAPIEEFWINDYRRTVPNPSPYRYHLLRWKGLYFTNYYCFELANIIHRSIFRSKIDFLVASEWNPDINYYSNITEATTRDIHCYFIQVNTSQFGDSRVTKPTKSATKDSLRIKGGLNTSLLVDELDKIRAFQYKGFGQQKDDKEFKPTPADYRHDDARKRQENKSFKRKSDNNDRKKI